MPQFARPDADLHNEGYTTESGGTTGLFQKINEQTPDDNTFVRSALAPTADVYVFRLSVVNDPNSSSGYVVRYRYGKDASAGNQVNQVVELRQGYVSEASQGTLIASWTHNDVGVGPIAATQTLTGPQADAITNHGDLQGRLVSTQV